MLNYTPRRPETERRTTGYVILCAWCRERQRYGNTWGPRTVVGDERNLSHGICPDCFRRERAKIEAPLGAPEAHRS